MVPAWVVSEGGIPFRCIEIGAEAASLLITLLPANGAPRVNRGPNTTPTSHRGKTKSEFSPSSRHTIIASFRLSVTVAGLRDRFRND